MAPHSTLRKISRSWPLAVPVMRPCYLTDSIFTLSPPHLILPSLPQQIYICLLTLLPPSITIIACFSPSFPVLAPSDTLKFNMI